MDEKPRNNIRATAVVFGHNQSHCIRESISSVLNQDFKGLEIILSDNASIDDTFEIMSEMSESYTGPHSIKLNKNKKNLGFIGHINQVFSLAQGQFIFYNPGDDISMPGRFQKIWSEYKRTNALLVHSDVTQISDLGEKIGDRSQQSHLDGLTLEQCARSMSLCIGSTCGWDRDIEKIFGKIIETDTYDDLVFYFRAMLAGNRIGYVPEPLVYYRVGSGMTNTPVRKASERILRLVYDSKIRLGTMKQRLLDCKNYPLAPPHIKRYLKFEIKISQGLLLAYQEKSYVSAIKTFSFTIFLGFMAGKRNLRNARKWPTAILRNLQAVKFFKRK